MCCYRRYPQAVILSEAKNLSLCVRASFSVRLLTSPSVTDNSRSRRNRYAPGLPIFLKNSVARFCVSAVVNSSLWVAIHQVFSATSFTQALRSP